MRIGKNDWCGVIVALMMVAGALWLVLDIVSGWVSGAEQGLARAVRQSLVVLFGAGGMTHAALSLLRRERSASTVLIGITVLFDAILAAAVIQSLRAGANTASYGPHAFQYLVGALTASVVATVLLLVDRKIGNFPR